LFAFLKAPCWTLGWNPIGSINALFELQPTANRNAEKPQDDTGANGVYAVTRGAYMRVLGPNRTDYFAAPGRLVAREVNGKNYTATGSLAANDHQGLRVLGQTLSRKLTAT
jgi:hypothetical protein